MTIDLPEGKFSKAELARIHGVKYLEACADLTRHIQEYEDLPGAVSVKPRRGRSKAEGKLEEGGEGRGRLTSLRNTWWVRVEEDRDKERRVMDEMSNETRQYVKHTPLYHSQRDRNKTENSLWENHCSLH